jgi:hypothetical protein
LLGRDDGAEFGAPRTQPWSLTWLAVRLLDTEAAIGVISDRIKRTARNAEARQKYNATVSRAWVEPDLKRFPVLPDVCDLSLNLTGLR